RSVYGPYERNVVMDQGSTPTNGPHQGAWVTTPGGENWFLHFQDREAYGRIVHLQPMKWVNDWPVIGVDKDGDGKGEPVLIYKKPAKNFTATTKLVFHPNARLENEKASLTVMGFSYASLGLESKKDGIYLVYTDGRDADKGNAEKESLLQKINGNAIYLRVKISAGAKCQFSYSFDGIEFTD